MVAKELAKYLKQTDDLANSMTNIYNDENASVFYKIKLLNGNEYSGGQNTQGLDSSFLCDNTKFKSALSGAIYVFNDSVSSLNTNGPVVCVDINGQKGPNQYGKDYFLFIFTTDGNVIPMGTSHDNNPARCTSSTGSCVNFSNVGAQYCSKQSNNITYNSSCAYYAFINKHPNAPDKTYWNDFL